MRVPRKWKWSRTVRPVAFWLLVLGLIWCVQLLWLYVRLGSPSWSEYWSMRGLYRPGIQVVDAGGREHLPGYVFNPLSPAGAKWAFILAAGVYAAGATALAWLMWRASEKRRKQFVRSLSAVSARPRPLRRRAMRR